MDWPWIIGIPLWFFIGWVAFAVFEFRALRHPERQNTLSLFLYNVGSEFPLSIALVSIALGMFIGIIATHILWHFCPPGSVSAG